MLARYELSATVMMSGLLFLLFLSSIIPVNICSVFCSVLFCSVFI